MGKLNAWVSQGKCHVCWQLITTKTMGTRPSKKFQGRWYHVDCWEKKYKSRKKAVHKKAVTKRSF